MKITASQVQQLRTMSGAGMMDCKKALVECEGDIDKAMDFLRSNSSIKADTKSSRVAADGKIIICDNDNKIMMVEINSETDFAAKDEKFENILPPLVLLSQAKKKELIDKLNKLEFVTEKNLAA